MKRGKEKLRGEKGKIIEQLMDMAKRRVYITSCRKKGKKFICQSNGEKDRRDKPCLCHLKEKVSLPTGEERGTQAYHRGGGLGEKKKKKFFLKGKGEGKWMFVYSQGGKRSPAGEKGHIISRCTLGKNLLHAHFS